MLWFCCSFWPVAPPLFWSYVPRRGPHFWCLYWQGRGLVVELPFRPPCLVYSDEATVQGWQTPLLTPLSPQGLSQASGGKWKSSETQIRKCAEEESNSAQCGPTVRARAGTCAQDASSTSAFNKCWLLGVVSGSGDAPSQHSTPDVLRAWGDGPSSGSEQCCEDSKALQGKSAAGEDRWSSDTWAGMRWSCELFGHLEKRLLGRATSKSKDPEISG